MTARLRQPLLLIGSLRAALRAVEDLGLSAVVVIQRGERRPEHPAVEAICEVDLHGPVVEIEASVRALLGARTPAAVVALAERTVVVAAHLRAVLTVPGNSPATALACADKLVMKRAMLAAGIPTAPWRELTDDTDADELVSELGLPLVIKPRRDSGGRQQRKLSDATAVANALSELQGQPVAERGYGWLAEGWVEGREMSIETFVHAGRPVFSSTTEYFVPRHANIVPAGLEPAAERELQAFSERALVALGVERGITHLEVFRTPRGLVFGELASRPPGGRLMTLIQRAWSFNTWQALLRLEQGEAVQFPAQPHRCAGVWILHPGAGTLTALTGLDAAREFPGVRRVALKVAVGDRIGERLGSGSDVCAVYSEGASRDAVAESLSGAVECLRFELS